MAPHSHSVENDHESCQGQAHHSHHSHHSHGLSKSTRLMIIIGISFAFFMGEISGMFFLSPRTAFQASRYRQIILCSMMRNH